jgi:hypothetical protein
VWWSPLTSRLGQVPSLLTPSPSHLRCHTAAVAASHLPFTPPRTGDHPGKHEPSLVMGLFRSVKHAMPAADVCACCVCSACVRCWVVRAHLEESRASGATRSRNRRARRPLTMRPSMMLLLPTPNALFTPMPRMQKYTVCGFGAPFPGRPSMAPHATVLVALRRQSSFLHRFFRRRRPSRSMY